MANLKDLAEITGQLSISDMTDEQLLEHVRQLRQSRLTPREKPKRERDSSAAPAAKKSRKKSIELPSNASLEDLVAQLTPEQLAELMAKMGA